LFKFNPYGYNSDKLEYFLKTSRKEKGLRRYLGDDYDRLAKLCEKECTVEPSKSKVFLIPGFLGSKLYRRRRIMRDKYIWLNFLEIIFGGISALKYDPNDKKTYAKGALFQYLPLQKSLQSQGYDCSVLAYDWRKSHLDEGKRAFEAIRASGHQNVVLVCHSLGGFLARRIAELDPDRKYVRRIITIATPHRGTLAPFFTLRGISPSFQLMAAADLRHTFLEIAEKVARHLPAYTEVLPVPGLLPNDLYKLDEWPQGIKIEEPLLKQGFINKEKIIEPDDRFRIIIGIGESTKHSFYEQDGEIMYRLTPDGDGQFPRILGEIGTPEQRYYINAEHSKILKGSVENGTGSQISLFEAIDDLIQTGETNKLYQNPEDYSKHQSPSLSEMKIVSETSLLSTRSTHFDLFMEHPLNL